MMTRFCISTSCELLGYTRQAFYKRTLSAFASSRSTLIQIIPDVISARKGRPTKGCRSIYEDVGYKWPIGRDKSVELLIDAGLGVRYPKKYTRATQAGNREFANLLVNKTVTSTNQVWQADMAHYLVGDKRFYTIYITDVFNQEIVGHGAYTSNYAENYAEVLMRAINAQKTPLDGLIHHSDGGKQYESTVYKGTCARYGIEQSMCMYSYENPYAEKTNDLINNGYLNCWKPTNIKDLELKQSQAVRDHNLNSKKKRLKGRSPLQFRALLNRYYNTPIYQLELKPRNPSQPRNKTLNLSN